jgi:hypothetical protein
MKNSLLLCHVTNTCLLSSGTKSHISDTLNYLHSLQGTQNAQYFQLTFYRPTSKLPLHPSDPEINTKSTITSVFFFTNLLTLVKKPLHLVTSKIILDLERIKFEPLSNYSTTQKLSVSSVLQIHTLFSSLKFCGYTGCVTGNGRF